MSFSVQPETVQLSPSSALWKTCQQAVEFCWSVGRFTGNTGCSSPPVWRCNQSIIPDVLGIIISAVHRTQHQKNRGLSVFPVALWLQILIKCLNDFPVCSFSQIFLTGGKWVLSKYFWGHLKSFASFCLWIICFSSVIHLCFLPEYVCVLKASHKPELRLQQIFVLSLRRWSIWLK